MADLSGGHWYAPDGSPQHTILTQKGAPRNTTLRDARKHGWLPSVTTILNVVAKPQLNDWRVREALKVAFDFAKDTMDSAEFVKTVMDVAHQPVQDAADEGSRIHAAIEASYIPDAHVHAPYRVHVAAVRDALYRHLPSVTDWTPEARVVSLEHGYAGTCDLHSRAHQIVADFKCKDFGNPDGTDCGKKMAYDQDIQIVAYAKALGFVLPQTRFLNVFVSRTVPGVVRIHEWTADPKWDAYYAWRTFDAAANLWRLLHHYDPRQIP